MKCAEYLFPNLFSNAEIGPTVRNSLTSTNTDFRGLLGTGREQVRAVPNSCSRIDVLPGQTVPNSWEQVNPRHWRDCSPLPLYRRGNRSEPSGELLKAHRNCEKYCGRAI